MLPDRSWMFRRKDPTGRVSSEFQDRVDSFIKFVNEHPLVFDPARRILCPCARCKNSSRMETFWVEQHLYSNGFMSNYVNWTAYGKKLWGASSSRNVGDENNVRDERTSYVHMVMDALDGDIDSEDVDMEDEPNPSAQKFYNLLRDADEPLWDGCKKHTILSAVTQLLNLKLEFNMSQSCFDRMIVIMKSMLPDSERLPDNFYKTKRMVNELGLGYEKIDACRNHCTLYYKEYENHTVCYVCGEPRYKARNEKYSGTQRDVPFKSLRYFPIAPRLRHMYMSKRTAEYMRWHAFGLRQDDSVITHPSDAEAWKTFNTSYPDFAKEIRNVRLGLCTDGFNPFTNLTYSCWPVFVTPYNLPPSMCMRKEYIFLALIIPGPKSPGKSLDVYLRPLIDELKLLWDEGVNTFDAWRKQNFMMKAALLWTISDFPAYGMLSGWSTHRKLACPYCMKDACSIVLKHGKKCSWFDCHRQFLPLEHPFRRDRNGFTKSREVRSMPPSRLGGDVIFEHVNRLKEVTFGLAAGQQKQPGFGKEHNWVKKSIFWELPYWSSNMVRHNLDVMHVEKNVFDNLFNTVMDLKGKTKDNANSREDLKLICNRPSLELVLDGDKMRKPKASYVLDDDARKKIYEWVKQLKFPDGYASNIGRCISTDGKIFGFKSHDCHVFMQRLVSLAFRDILPKPIWGLLAELSLFFQELCASKIRISTMENAEISIVETICKLEKNFPPAFFDVMEHLLVHLPYEAKVGGPVQYRWMYPFERCMLFLKRKVQNKARVEGSIYESYIVEEISNFVSLYFEPHLQTRHTQVPRNDDGGGVPDDNRLSIFRHPCRPFGGWSKYYLTDKDLHIIETYVLVNCIELEPYIEQFEDSIRSTQPYITDDEILRRRDTDFYQWLKKQVEDGFVDDLKIRHLSYGPLKSVRSYGGIMVNGYKFHTRQYGQHKATMNSGVCCRGSLYGDNKLDYYGVIEEILELSYIGDGNNVFILRCHWFDPINGIRYDERYRLIDIKHKSKLQTYELFILAQQAQQVYNAKYPISRVKGSGEWWAVCKVRASLFDAETLVDESQSDSQNNEYYQNDESPDTFYRSITHDEDVQLRDENAPMIEIPINEINIALDFRSVEQLIGKGEDIDDSNDNLMEGDNIDELESESESESETETETETE